MKKDQILKLIEEARSALAFSYSPYSKYAVAAALLTEEGAIFKGVNIENASYGATICAEQVAVTKAISEGYKNFLAIAIITSEEVSMPFPCGICRQVLSEFSSNMLVIVAKNQTSYKAYKLSDLLAHKFELK
jgi:cytidine deaminase